MMASCVSTCLQDSLQDREGTLSIFCGTSYAWGPTILGKTQVSLISVSQVKNLGVGLKHGFPEFLSV